MDKIKIVVIAIMFAIAIAAGFFLNISLLKWALIVTAYLLSLAFVVLVLIFDDSVLY